LLETGDLLGHSSAHGQLGDASILFARVRGKTRYDGKPMPFMIGQVDPHKGFAKEKKRLTSLLLGF
jgi:hypothetical protein